MTSFSQNFIAMNICLFTDTFYNHIAFDKSINISQHFLLWNTILSKHNIKLYSFKHIIRGSLKHIDFLKQVHK